MLSYPDEISNLHLPAMKMVDLVGQLITADRTRASRSVENHHGDQPENFPRSAFADIITDSRFALALWRNDTQKHCTSTVPSESEGTSSAWGLSAETHH